MQPPAERPFWNPYVAGFCLGLVLLARFVAGECDDLVSIFPEKPLITRTLWIAAPEDLFRIRRIRRVWDHIRDVVLAHPNFFRQV